ncbi:protein BIG GRAIN 1-like A [Andrographis paniculata]|uniref:protein BIG GRAIN 1-like A n=1 Tax=Andrographis paniculata TaxID=175694 RepID=UPI0021E813E3|nr:protein BIG GRAIN 1-like A [Andrographis paniculata]
MERVQRPRRCKTPSFSSSLLDAIYHSIDDQREARPDRRTHAAQVEAEIESLRRAIMVEKWMENYAPRHFSSNSASSTDSSAFSSSETDSSRSSKHANTTIKPAPKREGRFTRTKSRAMKIYGDLKKVKEPSSPGGKIASFFNSIFSPRNLKKNQALEDFHHPVRKSRSMKDTTATATSCLSKNHSSGGAGKSKRSVRFCPVSVILDQDSRPCGQKDTYINDGDECPVGSASIPSVVVGSHFIKKNINSFRLGEGKNLRRHHEFRDLYENNNGSDVDDRSCASSDLFELENIGRACLYEEELPVYGTTSVEINQAIANHRQIF